MVFTFQGRSTFECSFVDNRRPAIGFLFPWQLTSSHPWDLGANETLLLLLLLFVEIKIGTILICCHVKFLFLLLWLLYI